MTVTLEDQVVVALATPEYLLEDSEFVVCGGKMENVVIPIGFGLGSIKGHSLPDSVLEAHHEILGDIAKIAIKVNNLRDTLALVIQDCDFLSLPVVEVLFRLVNHGYSCPMRNLPVDDSGFEISVLDNALVKCETG